MANAKLSSVLYSAMHHLRTPTYCLSRRVEGSKCSVVGVKRGSRQAVVLGFGGRVIEWAQRAVVLIGHFEVLLTFFTEFHILNRGDNCFAEVKVCILLNAPRQ